LILKQINDLKVREQLITESQNHEVEQMKIELEKKQDLLEEKSLIQQEPDNSD